MVSYPFVMGAAAHLYLPVFNQIKITTSYEYLQYRYRVLYINLLKAVDNTNNFKLVVIILVYIMLQNHMVRAPYSYKYG